MDDNSKDIEKLENQINMISNDNSNEKTVDDHVVIIDSLTDNHIQKELEENTLKLNKIEELNDVETEDDISNTIKIDKIDEIYEESKPEIEKEVIVKEKEVVKEITPEKPEEATTPQPTEVTEEPKIIATKESYTVYYLIIVFLVVILSILLYFLFK